ncbi:MAG: MaoC family dehydratase [Anaerolineaceae bacterium]|nr:MaoC family dehydratase [Anaerolineaceae bacterium]
MRYYEDLQPGQRIRHRLARTLTETDNLLFCGLTHNPQPLHLDETFARETLFGRRIMNGLFTLGLVVGISVPELTQGTIVANLGYEQGRHPHPLYPGDTLSVETEVLAKRESRSRPGEGLVTLRHDGRNQDGVLCVEVTRTALFHMRPR